jgi:hypothetical protein
VVLQNNLIDTPTVYGISATGFIGKIVGNTIRNAGDVPILFATGATGLSGVEISRNTVSGTVPTRSVDLNVTHTNVVIQHNTTDKKIKITPAAGDLIRGNNTYVTSASGVTGAIASGATVTHGLGVPDGLAPAVVTLQAADGTPTAVYPSALGTTTFVVNYTGGGTHVFHWTARAACDP